ncbi:hypothetical protein PSYJA_27104 [Pseudomonas syringae pv. japonica str. M301072]|uniref:Uncharacterized protein n=1 Tax=Pseudomonas syringae pv. japonica str. M301072 TaxID=629262 RepID=F3FQD7_PSESX|nr:hypothetical protein PSYJA_27104 [Pseudomonas syringae pv. japonica str. M301072]
MSGECPSKSFQAFHETTLAESRRNIDPKPPPQRRAVSVEHGGGFGKISQIVLNSLVKTLTFRSEFDAAGRTLKQSNIQ